MLQLHSSRPPSKYRVPVNGPKSVASRFVSFVRGCAPLRALMSSCAQALISADEGIRPFASRSRVSKGEQPLPSIWPDGIPPTASRSHLALGAKSCRGSSAGKTAIGEKSSAGGSGVCQKKSRVCAGMSDGMECESHWDKRYRDRVPIGE